MTPKGNPAFVTIHELTPTEIAMLKMRMAQYPRTLRVGMNPELVGNCTPLTNQTSEVENQYWWNVCKISAQQQTATVMLDRPIPPKSLQRALQRVNPTAYDSACSLWCKRDGRKPTVRRFNRDDRASIAHAIMHLEKNNIADADYIGHSAWYIGNRQQFVKRHKKAIALLRSLLLPS